MECTYKSSLKKLVMLQNKIIKIKTYSKPKDSSQPFMYTKDFQAVTYQHLIGRFMFRYRDE